MIERAGSWHRIRGFQHHALLNSASLANSATDAQVNGIEAVLALEDSGDGEPDVHVVARGVRVRTDLVRGFD
jgi:hypothetical protein